MYIHHFTVALIAAAYKTGETTEIINFFSLFDEKPLFSFVINFVFTSCVRMLRMRIRRKRTW